MGSATGALGLEGTVDPVGFRAVLAGIDPATGHALVSRAGDGRVTGFDLTFSSPKSVSVLWALGDEGVAAAVASAHDQAIAETMRAFEVEVIRARRGHG